MNSKRRIVVITTGRQDFGILRSTLVLLREHPSFELLIWAGGMHLSDEHGRSADLIVSDGFDIDEQLAGIHVPSDVALDVSQMIAATASAIRRNRPDAMLVVGDRHETLAVGIAATLERVPLIHLHGGEETEGAVDNAFRHALTKLSHLHLVSHEIHARRVVQMGEDPSTVHIVGAPGLDNASRDDLSSRKELESIFGIEIVDPIIVVSVHPTTLSDLGITAEAEAIADALEAIGGTIVVTLPNADSGGGEIREFWTEWLSTTPNGVAVPALGERAYWGLLRIATVVVGNSSSGVIEAPSVGVPTINVGSRQRGRLKHGNHVVDVAVDHMAIREALCAALADDQPDRRVRSRLYPQGAAAPRIVEAITMWDPPQPPTKGFVDSND